MFEGVMGTLSVVGRWWVKSGLYVSWHILGHRAQRQAANLGDNTVNCHLPPETVLSLLYILLHLFLSVSL